MEYEIKGSFAGIDPGADGAIALVSSDGVRFVPFEGKGNEPKFIASLAVVFPESIPIYIEGVHFQGRGTANASTFDFIGGARAIEAIAHARSSEVEIIEAALWTGVIKASVCRRQLDGKNNPKWKSSSRAIANAYFKAMGLPVKLDSQNDPKYGCSEAFLIGLYGAIRSGRIQPVG